LCIRKLSYAAAKSELKGNCEKFDNELGKLRTPDGLADSRVSSRDVELTKKVWERFRRHRKIGKLIIPIHKGDRSECTNYRGISLLSLPGRVYAKFVKKR